MQISVINATVHKSPFSSWLSGTLVTLKHGSLYFNHFETWKLSCSQWYSERNWCSVLLCLSMGSHFSVHMCVCVCALMHVCMHVHVFMCVCVCMCVCVTVPMSLGVFPDSNTSVCDVQKRAQSARFPGQRGVPWMQVPGPGMGLLRPRQRLFSSNSAFSPVANPLMGESIFCLFALCLQLRGKPSDG